MFKAKHYKKKREKKPLWYMYVQSLYLIRLFLLNRIWISKTEIIINRKKKRKNMHHSL